MKFAVGSGNCYANSNPVFFSRVESESNRRLYQTEMMMRQVTSILLSLLQSLSRYILRRSKKGLERVPSTPTGKLFTTPLSRMILNHWRRPSRHEYSRAASSAPNDRNPRLPPPGGSGGFRKVLQDSEDQYSLLRGRNFCF